MRTCFYGLQIFCKMSKGSVVNIKVKDNEQLAKELYKKVIRNVKKEQFILDLKTILGVLV